MKRPVRFLKTLVVLAIVLATALYVERVRFGDLWREATAPELPVAVSYGDVAGEPPQPTVPSPEEPTVKPVPSDPSLTVPTEENAPDLEQPVPTPDPVAEEPVSAEPVEDDPPASLPASINLSVPFTSQAPFGNWDEVHEETCEEASVYMAALFYDGVSGTIDAQTAEDELQRLVAWETERFGYYKDTTAAETAEMVSTQFGNPVKLLYDPTVEGIKAELAAGHPVVVPAAGQELGNPYFTAPGPIYHMFVIRGYTADRFIVNDPGTRHGEAYTYSVDVVMDAIHDWNGGDVHHGAKAVIVVLPS